ncbi:CPBP family intramembrane glutamic endopeptidase [Mollicutes bacterium LVI A0039]|nr:CPBP family intramembrane glutamic endopeptidase [Mollicutes bacterium LVI A0039]
MNLNENQNEIIEDNSIETTAKTTVNPWIERAKGILLLIIFYISQQVAAFFMVLLIISLGGREAFMAGEFKPEWATYTFWGMFISNIIFIIALIYHYRSKLSISLHKVLLGLGKFSLKTIGYFVLFTVVTILFNVLDTMLFPQFVGQVGENQEMIDAALTGTPSLGMILAICVGAPIVEEYVFRYGLISKLSFGLNKYIGVVIAALVFSFYHIGFSQMGDLAYFAHLMLGYLGSALVFGFVYVREDNLAYPIVIHMLGNIQSVIFIIASAGML